MILYTGTDIIQALEHRKGDNQATEFLSKLSSKAERKWSLSFMKKTTEIIRYAIKFVSNESLWIFKIIKLLKWIFRAIFNTIRNYFS